MTFNARARNEFWIRGALRLGAALVALGTTSSAWAQIDIAPPLPNVLLLVDTSGSMEYLPDGTTRKPNAIFVKVRPDGTVHAYPLTK